MSDHGYGEEVFNLQGARPVWVCEGKCRSVFYGAPDKLTCPTCGSPVKERLPRRVRD